MAYPLQGYVAILDVNGNPIGGSGGSSILPTNGTATTAQVGDSATAVTLKAANTARIGLTVSNESSASLYLKLGASASTTDHMVVIPANGYWELPTGNGMYTGLVTGIWASDAGGNAYVTEW